MDPRVKPEDDESVVGRMTSTAIAASMISPLVGEMSGRTEGGAVPQCRHPRTRSGPGIQSAALPPVCAVVERELETVRALDSGFRSAAPE